MDEIVIMALLATLGTWSVTALGAATVVFFKTPNPKALNLMLGFAAGVMIAASFWSLLQPAIERAEATSSMPAYFVATAGFLCGALFMWGSDKIVSYTQGRANSSQGRPNERLNRIIMLVLSITLHNIPEGLAVGVAFGSSTKWQQFNGKPYGGCHNRNRDRIAKFPRRCSGIHSPEEGRILQKKELFVGAGFGDGGTDCRRNRRIVSCPYRSHIALCPFFCGRSHDSRGSPRVDSRMPKESVHAAIFCNDGNRVRICRDDAARCYVGVGQKRKNLKSVRLSMM